MKHQPTSNFDERSAEIPIDMLVLHYTGMESAQAAIDRLCDPGTKVSAHYVIDEDGALTQLVGEDCRAWHAGEACWRGDHDINARSIGIELVNPGHEFGLSPFPEKQMQALEKLALNIISRYQIPARNVVGHSDVAPRRKTDPGELFDWFRLFKAGVGVWPEDALSLEMNQQEGTDLLAKFGYETVDFTKTVEAFQRHFRPTSITGSLDGETAGLLDRLIAVVG
ncbi:MAG: N-acetylmuramoyl-L-alanine amidase [Rhodospirillaceae bacterium]|jgi:N-acetylmuramoyl-L-alanine amidase|nr:N-acetylmuramoyl-L-alanine amidase [Rhodospirillaceae bacterium]MBT5245357.1 N-acetylmuramoyl-L-alanine amidase [Rhodospirillaceae bacterium]MBT5562315.1 N-acetylmuramoyl-L-alanine amidase [Rhodospirillaceae bacterium]MBT6242694.1 N-acetylmuramoyl-L-alanine amidase [Rhodospirillaceae bacterium]MBT7138255.1 N-acetylmuramoyl-L-alanine amidase [Rhodospirillaceae bacterium]